MSSIEFSAQGEMVASSDDFLSTLGAYEGEGGVLSVVELNRKLLTACDLEFDISEFGANWECSLEIDGSNFDLVIDAASSTQFELFDTLIDAFQSLGLQNWKALYFDSSTGSKIAWVFEDGEPVDNELDLNDLKVVFTGKMEEGTREEMQELAEEHGAIIQKAVNGSTDLLVTGANVGQKKLEKAQSLGISIISEQDFMASLEYCVDV